MQKAKLNELLQELYAWNIGLKDKEDELIKLIEAMLNSKPDTKFDEQFANQLKKDLLSHRILLDSDDGLKENNFLFNLKSMNKKIYFSVGAVAVLGVAILAIMLNTIPRDKIALENTINNGSKTKNTNQFVKAKPGAFGSLAALSNVNASTASVQENGVATPRVITNVSDSAVSSPSLGMGGGGDVASSKMIAPMRSYAYVYKGDPIELSDSTGTVYRRIKGDGNLSNNLDSLISSKTFGPINLSSFSDLQTGNISLIENKKLGLNINIDFREESIYIGQNWSQWQSDRDNCGDNQACWESYRIKIDNIPADTDVIAKTNNFLAQKGINLEHYGTASVDNNWRINYDASLDKVNYYIPEEVSVIYPLIVNGQTVYDQNGNLDGLRVNYNLLQNAISSLSNLTSYRYETSDYSLETDGSKIIGLAERGGYGSGIYYLNEPQNKITLDLGTPTKSLIRLWRYTNGSNEELLIPALIFPVTNTPTDYYGSRFITVPLVQEMIKDLENNNGGYSGGGIMPMLK